MLAPFRPHFRQTSDAYGGNKHSYTIYIGVWVLTLFRNPTDVKAGSAAVVAAEIIIGYA